MANSVTHSFVSAKVDAGTPGEISPTDWNDGHVLNITGDSAWTVPTMGSGWVNYGAPYSGVGYRKDGQGFVHLRGLIKSGTIAATIFTLPVGYRPASQTLFGTISNGAVGRVDVYADGSVQALSPSNNTWVSLEGLFFYAEG